MTQYTVDIFGWDFNYSSDISDLPTLIFTSVIIGSFISICVITFCYRVLAFMYFAEKLYDWKTSIDNYDVYFGRLILVVFGLACGFYSFQIFWVTSFVCMIAYTVKNFIIQPKEIIIINKITNIRDYEITSMDAIDTKYIIQEQKQEQEQEKTKSD